MSETHIPVTTASYVAISDEAEHRAATTFSWKICGIASLAVSLCIFITLSFIGPDSALLPLMTSLKKQHVSSLNASEQSWQVLRCIPTVVQVPHVDDMTLEEKIGQMTQANILTLLNGEDIHKYFIGSVVSGGGAFPASGNNAPDWADMTDTYQAQAMKTRLRIPMIYGVDAVHGHNNVYGATIFPHHVGLGATRNQELVKKVAAVVSEEVASTGIRWAFSPAVSVCRDPRWGRCYESFSEDPNLVVNLTAVVTGWQTRSLEWDMPGRYQVAACAKHYMGDGGTSDGQDQGNTIIPESELRRVHLPPYIEAIRRGVLSIMVSYSSWNGMKMSENKYLVTDVLKRELGFEGVIVSDWRAIDQLNGTYAEQVCKGINAGIDMVMVPDEYVAFTSTLKQEVLSGRVPMSRIDDAVTRILNMKEALGLFQNGCAPRAALPKFGGVEHREVARAAVRESLVLLKNENRRGVGSMFPLPIGAGTRILVTGNHSNNVGLQCGGWTVDWQGSTNKSITIGTTLLDGIVNKTGHLGVEVRHTEHGDAAVIDEFKPDFAIVGVGELPYSEKGGDNHTMQLDTTALNTLRLVCSKVPCIVVLFSGRPLQIDYLLGGIDVFVAAWLPGSEGGSGIADVLFGKSDFKGTLPMTWFSDTKNIPMNLDSQPYGPLMFPYGFGLNKAGEQLDMPYGDAQRVRRNRR